MVYLSKIYTRTGDDGNTSLGDGTRVRKTHPRIEAYGTADELGAVIGVAAAFCEDPEVVAAMRRVQNDLFDLGADLCVPERDADEGGETPPPTAHLRMRPEQTARLESEIDRMNADLAPLKSFVLSGGTPAGAHLHLARTVARRCERCVRVLEAHEAINPEVPVYLNRLSDFLFVAARFVNLKGGDEILWKPGGADGA